VDDGVIHPRRSTPARGPTGGIGAAPEGYPGHVTFYVLVDDPAETLEEIEAKGGKIVQPVMEIPNGPHDRSVRRPGRQNDRSAQGLGLRAATSSEAAAALRA
jgi:hypothetical protein